jgi:P-type conjugative transfer protein TrbL
MDIITTTINSYNKIFAGYLNQFLQWGEWLFYSCLIISIVWLCLWKAFDSYSFQDAMSGFIKEFFVIAFFYTVMINAGPWLSSIVDTATTMGTNLAQQKVDPASIIAQGFAIANALMAAANNTSFLINAFSVLIASASYVIILFVFFSIALDLAVTIILNSILISIASMSLAFAAFPFTRSVARKTLDLVVVNSIKLLVLYIGIAAGSGLLVKIAELIPSDKITTFDTFGWVVVSCLLFWAIAKYIPKNIAKIFIGMVQEVPPAMPVHITHPTTAALNPLTVSAVSNIAKIQTAESNIAGSRINNATSSRTMNSSLSEHFKNIAGKRT